MIYEMEDQLRFCLSCKFPLIVSILPGSICRSHGSELILQFLNLMKCCIYLRFAPNQLRQRYFRQSVLHNLVEPYDHRPNAAITRVNTNIQYPGVRLTKLVDRVLIQNADYFIQSNVCRRPRQRVSTFGSPLRRNQPRLVENPHQLAGVGDRQSLALSELRQR